MEAVAAHAGVHSDRGSANICATRRLGAMKRGIETGDLGQFGACSASARIAARLCG